MTNQSTITIKTGDIVHRSVAAMNHGVRPCVVIGITGQWAHLVPLSSDNWGNQPYVKAMTGEGGHSCPNRYHKARATDLRMTTWLSTTDTARIWDSVFG